MAEGAEGKARVRVLGGFEVLSPAGLPVTVSGRKAQGLLAILALSPGFMASRDRLAGLLWSDRGDEQARNSLRQALVALRKDLGDGGLDIIEAEREQVRLVSERLAVDAVEMVRLASEGRSAEAATLYSGPLLDGIHVRDDAFEEWATGERQRLADLAFEVHEGTYVAASGSEQLTAARKLLVLDPMREAAHRAVIQALAAAGERDQALRQYEACRDMLARELGTEPSAETERLKVAIMSGERRTKAAQAAQSATFAIETERTSVAVPPFANLSGNSEQDFFADGLSEDLIAELSRYRHLSVVAHRTTAGYKGRTGDPREIGRELGVDFLIEGSVRQAVGRVRVAVRLIDAKTGGHMWADKFDREMSDIFAVQDAIISAVVARLSFNIDRAAGEQRQRDPTASSNAYTCFLKARAAGRTGDQEVALECLKQAIAIDPNYGRALAYLGFFYSFSRFSMAAGLDDAETARLARHYIERGLAADRSDPFILDRAALTYLMLGEPLTARRYGEAAARSSPRDAGMLIVNGLVLACCGYPTEGVAMMKEAIKLEPDAAPATYAALSDACFLLGDYEASLAALDMIPHPHFYFELSRVPSLSHLGRQDEAKRIVAQAPESFDMARFAHNAAGMCARPEDAERWLEGFRLGGVPV